MRSRVPWLIACGIFAASAGDPLVESISNAGLFGTAYTDTNHAGVVPALLLGILLAVVAGFVRVRDVRRSGAAARRPAGRFGARVRCSVPVDGLPDILRAFGRTRRRFDLAIVYAVQLAAVYGIESVEQLMTGGRIADGSAWLGAPPLFALLAHAAVGALVLSALAAFMGGLAHALVTVVRGALRSFRLAITRSRPVAAADPRTRLAPLAASAPRSRATRGRAPPRLLRRPAH